MILSVLPLVLVIAAKTVQNILNKTVSQGSSTVLTAFSTRIVPFVVLLIITLYSGVIKIVPLDIFSMSVFNGLLLGLGGYFLVEAYRQGEISLITPLYAFTPLVAMIASFIVIGETPTILGFIGVVLVVFGVYILGLQDSVDLFDPVRNIFVTKGSRSMLYFVVIGGVIAPFDKIGVNAVGQLNWIFYVYMISSIVLLLMVLYSYSSEEVLENIDGDYAGLILIGLVTFVFVYSLMTAYQYFLVSYVLSIFLLSILTTNIVGWIFFDEQFDMQKLIATIIMILGAVLITIS